MSTITTRALILRVAGLIAMLMVPLQPSGSQGSIQDAGEIRVEVHFAAEAERKAIPFEMLYDHLLFRARVQGREVWAMLDNGSSVSIIDRNFARSQGLQFGPNSSYARTLGSNLEVSPITDVGVEIPGQIKMQAVLYATDLSAFSKLLARPISLVIGKDYFDILSVLITPSNRTFQLGPSGALTVPAGTPYLALKGDKPQIDISVGGRPAAVTIDLGYNGTFQIGEQAAKRLALDTLPVSESSAAGADGRPYSVKSTIVDQLAVGPINATQIPVNVGPVPPDSADGLIGTGFLGRYDFAIDMKGRRIYLFGPAAAQAPDIRTDAEGAAFLYKLGRTTEAERRFAELAERAKTADDFNNLCFAKATSGILLNLAIEECGRALALGGRVGAYLDSLGLALLQAGRSDEALATYNEAIDKAHLADSFMGRAIIHARKGNVAQARSDLGEARKRDPGIEQAFAAFNLEIDEI